MRRNGGNRQFNQPSSRIKSYKHAMEFDKRRIGHDERERSDTTDTRNASLSSEASEWTPSHTAKLRKAAQVTKGNVPDTAIALVSGPSRQISG